MGKKSLLVGTALASLLIVGGCAQTSSKSLTKGKCYGLNGCKGKGMCSSKYNKCKGKNSCKGKGWLKKTESECSSKGGQFKA